MSPGDRVLVNKLIMQINNITEDILECKIITQFGNLRCKVNKQYAELTTRNLTTYIDRDTSLLNISIDEGDLKIFLNNYKNTKTFE